MDEQLRGENMLSAVCAKASCSLSSWGLDLAARDFVNEVDASNRGNGGEVTKAISEGN